MNDYKKITDYLTRCIERDRLSHAYIFYGPDKLSKHKTAFWFANKLLKNDDEKFHPDLFSINSITDEEITLDLIHQLKAFLTLRPYSGDHKAVIIEAAEKLNIYAQDALLKIFEETPNYAIIVLCAKTIDSISETIASRAVKLPFWQIHSEIAPKNEIIIKAFGDLLETDFSKKYNILEKFSEHKASEIFKLWLDFIRIKFRADPTKKLFYLLKASQNIYFKLNETNINPKLAYDELILSLWKI